MADIRIKDLATTAASTASDDFLAVDGSANGTRKLNAFSPTFGGNVVATGTLTVNSTTDSSSKDTGAIITEGGLGVEKSATIGGNLTVSGTGNSQINGNLGIGSSPSSWGSAYKAIELSNNGSLSYTVNSLFAINNAYFNGSNWVFNTNGYALSYQQNKNNGAHDWYSSNSGTAGGTPSFALLATLTRDGNLILNSTGTDTGQKLQVNGTAYVSGDATFAGKISATSSGTNIVQLNLPFTSRIILGEGATNNANPAITLYRTTGGNAQGTAIRLYQPDSAGNFLIQKGTTDAVYGTETYTTQLAISPTGDATFTGAIAIGNTVNTVSPTSPNRTITMVIGGTTYYIHAKTTND